MGKYLVLDSIMAALDTGTTTFLLHRSQSIRIAFFPSDSTFLILSDINLDNSWESCVTLAFLLGGGTGGANKSSSSSEFIPFCSFSFIFFVSGSPNFYFLIYLLKNLF